MAIEIYGFENEEDVRVDFLTEDSDVAREHAQQNGLAWVVLRYEYIDSELVMDFRPSVREGDSIQQRDR